MPGGGAAVRGIGPVGTEFAHPPPIWCGKNIYYSDHISITFRQCIAEVRDAEGDPNSLNTPKMVSIGLHCRIDIVERWKQGDPVIGQ